MDSKIRLVKYRLLFIAIGGGIIASLLQYQYVFHLFFLEQLQLFLSGKEYARELLSLPGGFTAYLSEYCVQFFSINYVGSSCVTIFLLLIGLTLHLLLRNDRKGESFIFIFESGILLLLLINVLDISFYFKGMVGYLFCVAVLLVYRGIQIHPFFTRFFYNFLLALFLFWIAAPFQTLFLITASCIELREYGLNKGKSLLPLLMAGISGYLVHAFWGSGVYRMYVDLDGVCSLRIIPGWTKYAAWMLLPTAVLFTPLLERLVKLIKKNHITVAVQCFLILAVLVFLLPRYDDNRSLTFKQLHLYASQEKWDDILDYCKKHPLNDDHVCLNYQNLALVEKGILADSLLAYTQKGKYGLFAPWDRTVYTAFAIQKVCYSYGDIAFAQKFAFEGNVNSVTKGFPETMKMLVRTNILQKEYQVAAKYINYLRQTLSYKEWADKQFRYLADTTAMGEDPEYKEKLKFLEKENHFAFSNELCILAGLDKNDRKLRDFVLCSFLLDKDLKGFLNWFDFYFKDTDLQDIPTIYYQAIMACAPSVPEVLVHYLVPEDIKEEFKMYSLVYSSGRNPEERKKWLSSKYENSYWYYFHYTEVVYE